MTCARCLLIFFFLALVGCDPSADSPIDEPAETSGEQYYTGYYSTIAVSSHGDDLKAQLHELIDGHQPLSYRELPDALASTDADPNNPGHILLFYTGWSRSADLIGNDPSGWNREHIWARSRGDFGKRQGAGTDLHAIRPTDVTVNSARGNKAFDVGGEPYIDGDGPTGCRSDRDSWEPRPEVRGDVARAIFYMAVRYEDAELDLELTDDASAQRDSEPLHGVASTLLLWHQQDPPDDAERLRNDRVQALQGNRNPFVDHPEWVSTVWDMPATE